MTWGDPEAGGDSSQVQEQLRNVQSIQGNFGAFAAILESGSVVTWVIQKMAEMQEQLRKVQHIQAPAGAFATILESGAVATWLWVKISGIPFWGRCTAHVRLF